MYSTYLGGSDNAALRESGNGIAVDSHGNAYITGSTGSADFPIKNAFQKQLKSPGSGDGFVTKLDRDGDSLIYSTYLGGSGCGIGCASNDSGQGIAVDRRGEAYVTGTTFSTDFPTKNAFQDFNDSANCVSGFCGNAFVAKIDAAGCALIYSSYLGGSLFTEGGGIAVDTYGNAYLTGTTGPDSPPRMPFSQCLAHRVR